MIRRSLLSFSPGAAGRLLNSARDLDWHDRAACQYTDPEIFFPRVGVNATEARRVCAGCEVRKQCLEWALETDEEWGVYGGLSPEERRRVQLGRARAALAALTRRRIP